MTTPTQVRSLKIFCSYSHKDEDLRKRLEEHLASLRREQRISQWHDREIGAGKEWKREIDTHLNTANIILLLISPGFIDSNYCYGVELERAMQRHEKGEARVIPIILRPCDWKSEQFDKLQALPTNAKPVTKWSNRDSAFTDIVKGIREVVEEILQAQGVELRKPTLENQQKLVSEAGPQVGGSDQRSKLATHTVPRVSQATDSVAQPRSRLNPWHWPSLVRVTASAVLISLLAVAFLIARNVSMRTSELVSELIIGAPALSEVSVDGVPKGQIPNEGNLRVGNLKSGSHTIVLTRRGCEPVNDSIELKAGDSVHKNYELEPGYSESFGNDLSRWVLPTAGAWTLRNGWLAINNAKAPGYSRDFPYADFVLRFNILLTKDASAAWALRVQNPGNYYLFCVSKDENKFCTYKVVNGTRIEKKTPQGSFPIVPVFLKAGAQYTIEVEAYKTHFRHWISTASNPHAPAQKGLILGDYTDFDSGNVLTYGEIGFLSAQSESFKLTDLQAGPFTGPKDQ